MLPSLFWRFLHRCNHMPFKGSGALSREVTKTFASTAGLDIPGDDVSLISSNDQETLPMIPPRPPLPIMTSRTLLYPPPFTPPRQAWVVNLDTIEEVQLGCVDLHPDIFATSPRLDFIHQNMLWQLKYRHVNWDFAQSRAEVRGGGRKPWPQKGTGRARHGSIRSPLWIGGGVAHGPRGPKTYFYMLPYSIRVRGLAATLSVKFAQDDIHIVDTLQIPSDDPKYLERLIEQRRWGLSVLFVDDTDIMPRNIALATSKIKHFNLMPVYGLNVFSMLKHETLVLTVEAVERIEKQLLSHLNKLDCGLGEDFYTNLRDEQLPM